MMQEENHIFKGMRRATHPIRQNKEYLWGAYNVRLTTREGDTMLSITTEKSTKEIYVFNNNESYVGHTVIGDYLVLFIHGASDYIMRINLETMVKVYLYKGNLGLSAEHPIQAITCYESDLIQKVYWVDGINSPRYINIMKPKLNNPSEDEIEGKDYTSIYNEAPFGFIQDLELKENVSIQRIDASSGVFPAGVVQYAFTYYHKYGQETNIVWVSELNYTSYGDRGGSPEDVCSCAFNITIKGIDTKFEYIRIYSIVRTSLNAVPTVKRVVDLSLSKNKDSITYLDTNTTGEIIDPTYLLYVGGKDIIANCIASKDNTLFLGGITYKRKSVYDLGIVGSDMKLNPAPELQENTIIRSLPSNSKGNQLSKNTATFKGDETYRVGCRFQYKTGEWSEPVWINDFKFSITNGAAFTENNINSKELIATLPEFLINVLKANGYKRAQALIAQPTFKDRTILAQGVVCPTVGNVGNRKEKSGIWAQSSWLFRPTFSHGSSDSNYKGINARHKESLPFGITNDVEIQTMALPELGYPPASVLLDKEDESYYGAFIVDNTILTMHSPDIEFGEVQNILASGIKTIVAKVGEIQFTSCQGSIDIQTETPPSNPLSTGVINKSFSGDNGKCLISGLFYEDDLINEIGEKIGDMPSNVPVTWMVYMWNRSGSLNNDITRNETTGGTRTAVLKKKRICNFRASKNTTFITPEIWTNLDTQFFNSNELQMVKINTNDYGNVIYYGNIDTFISAYTPYKLLGSTDKNFNGSIGTVDGSYGYKFVDADVGGIYRSLIEAKDGVRMKYKSTPHVIVSLASDMKEATMEGALNLIELRQEPSETRFGGNTEDAIKNTIWIPAGNPVQLASNMPIRWQWGDTWFQKYECLKTYPFTFEDENQVTDIGSFYCETRVNMSGRYDRNEGSMSYNLSPTNFNLINPVYSQLDNFFTSKVLDKDYYKVSSYPSQFIWTKSKLLGADIDEWTNLNMASTYDMDGSYGALVAIQAYNDLLLGFQESAVSQILFDSRIQIQASDGVPIEIANSQKVEGVRAYSNVIGCQDKFSITTSALGVYFIDNNNSTMYRFNGNIENLGVQLGNQFWFRDNLPNNNWMFKSNKEGNPGLRLYYDPKFQDVYIVPSEYKDASTNLHEENMALCYSEQLGEFTSMIRYNGGVLFPYKSKFYSLANNNAGALTLWENFAGNDYGCLFGKNVATSISFISNDNPLYTKVFDTIEMRSDLYNNKLLIGDKYSTTVQEAQPFETIRVTNEYQDTGEVKFTAASLRKKFRIWRGTVPRNQNTRERVRNPWTKITLKNNNQNHSMLILHDISVKYTI